jgi:hypothetical protein
MRRGASSILIAVLSVASTAPAAAAGDLARELRAAAPRIDPALLELGLAAAQCAASGEAAPAQRLVLIDFSLPSTQRRLWVLDLPSRTLLHETLVAHGRGSGEKFSTSFSNLTDSHQSSLGLFRTAETYVGGYGYSLRLDGLEPGINHRAREREIVIHGADYVSDATARSLGHLGRSWGCPALPIAVTRQLIDDIKDGQLLFAYYPDASWLDYSSALACKAGQAALRKIAERPVATTAPPPR